MSACLTCSVEVRTSIGHVYPHSRGINQSSLGGVSFAPRLASAELLGLSRTLPMYKDSLRISASAASTVASAASTACSWTYIRVSRVHQLYLFEHLYKRGEKDMSNANSVHQKRIGLPSRQHCRVCLFLWPLVF